MYCWLKLCAFNGHDEWAYKFENCVVWVNPTVVGHPDRKSYIYTTIKTDAIKDLMTLATTKKQRAQLQKKAQLFDESRKFDQTLRIALTVYWKLKLQQSPV